MFFRENCVRLLDEGGIKDFFWFVLGITGLMSFAKIAMPEWTALLMSAPMLMTGMVYRFLTVEKSIVHNQPKLNQHNVIDFILSKNSLVFLFLSIIILFVWCISSLLTGTGLNSDFLRDSYRYCFFVLGTEKLILIGHDKPIESYSSGNKRDALEDVRIGMKGWINSIPTFINIGIFTGLFFVVGLKPLLSLSIGYWVSCIVCFILVMKVKFGPER